MPNISNLKMTFLLCLIVVSLYSAVHSNCVPGTTVCTGVRQSTGQSTWTACLTTELVPNQDISQCLNTNITVNCVFPCNITGYGAAKSPIGELCQCASSSKSMLLNANLDCFAPQGTDCSWYSQCLEAKIPCENTSDKYALSYAQKYCQLYGSRYSSFSINGRQWIDAVRKCLQVKLVPIMYPTTSITCPEIKKKAFVSHTGCYVKPSPGAPSFCELSFSDKFQVLMTIKGAMLTDFWESLTGVTGVVRGCLGYRLNSLISVII